MSPKGINLSIKHHVSIDEFREGTTLAVHMLSAANTLLPSGILLT